MRPNANSGCCTLENVTNATPRGNSHKYALPTATQLHTQSKQLTQQQKHHQQHQQQKHEQQQQQQQQAYTRPHFYPVKQPLHQHRHHQQHHQPFFQQQSALPWLPSQQQNVCNILPYATNTSNKNMHIARHQQQSAPYNNSPLHASTLNQNHKPQPSQMHPPALLPTQPLQYNQHIGTTSRTTQPPYPVHQNNFVHGFSTLRMLPPPPPERLGASTTPTQLHAPNFSQAPLKSSALVDQQRINECAGIPLISNATAHLATAQRQRIQRKLSHSPVSIQKLPVAVAVAASGLYMTHNTNATHIYQLAAHAQGAPLLLPDQQTAAAAAAECKWSMPNNVCKPQTTTSVFNYSTSTGIFVKSNGEKSARIPLRHQHSAPAALTARTSKENNYAHMAPQENAATAEISNENADECADTVLPRIIKPRKRRKKERKSTNNGILLKLDALTAASSPLKETDSKRKLCQQSQLLSKQQEKQQLQHQQRQCQQQQHHLSHSQYLYTQENTNNNLNKLLDIYTGSNEHTMESARNSNTLSSNPSQFDNNFLQSNCINATTICLKQASTKQCVVDAQDNLGGVCFCRVCDPLRSIWDYPLRRSLSDSSTASIRTHSSSASSASSNTSSTETASSSCSSALSAPPPLIEDSQPSRIERVGVIGSQRNNTQDSNHRDVTKPATNGCLSDSNDSHDSGYGDILSGINIVDDFFSQHSYNLTAALTPLLEAPTALRSPAVANKSSATLHGSLSSAVTLLPASADALLSESIKEISRKLIETCGSELPPNELDAAAADVVTKTRSLSAYSRCSSDFSNDSGIDSAATVNCDELIFKFENLNFILGDIVQKNALDVNNNSNNATVAACDENIMRTKLGAMPAVETENAKTTTTNTKLDFLISGTSNQNIKNDVNNNIECDKEQQHNQQFINNCFDLVWPTTFEHCLRNTAPNTTVMNEEKEFVNRTATYAALA
ncbi:probable basic-leucine zipper transcription factor Q [Eurosta solidaginis]|uniref:probable basic-leucine zipper transcription factor Q n=1 Tax=Eurosta solidaginis TaxID=178769 RepID=UPI0035311F7E